jgi:hypothetical protein
MKLILDNNQLNGTPEMFLRQAGYTFLEDRKTGNESFARPLNRGYYPRFHLYLDQLNGRVVLNLHLDQKQASYAGARAHNGEYDGELIAAEMARIKELVTRLSSEVLAKVGDSLVLRSFSQGGQPVTQNAKAGTDQNILDQIRPKQFNAARKRVEKKSWWRKFFR